MKKPTHLYPEMSLEAIIIHLILQDLRHNQLLLRLERDGMDTDVYQPDIMHDVAQLMGLPEKKITDQFVGVYTSYMDEAIHYEVTGRGDSLIHLAEKCYAMLQACIEIERRNEPAEG